MHHCSDTSDTYVVAYVVYPKIHRASRPSATVVARGGDGVLDSAFAEVFGWGWGLIRTAAWLHNTEDSVRVSTHLTAPTESVLLTGVVIYDKVEVCIIRKKNTVENH